MSSHSEDLFNSESEEYISTRPTSPVAGPSRSSSGTSHRKTSPSNANGKQKKTRSMKGDGKDSSECSRVLTEIFGHSNFKGKQKEIVEAAYSGSDVLVVAPTGMGKSLCFQIPAIADKRGVSIVVSPLLALMQNQVENLRLKNVEVSSLNSQIPYLETKEIERQLQLYDCPLKLLYITPEKLCTTDFMELLDTVYENHNLNRLVVDEAHCISEWGHDFRAEYRRIGKFRERYPDVPIMALTATATDAVRKDIIKSLNMDQKRLYLALHPFNRGNLFYEVRYLSNPDPLNQMADIFDYITTIYRRRGQASSGIVYCRFRKTCDDLAGFLRGKGLNARPYHRGISSSTLDKTLKSWTNGVSGDPGTVDLVVATIAFGLGIDKGDVRYIIHYDLPKSLEGFYQETGRAGRDGNPAKCILYYSREDVIRLKQFVRPGNPYTIRDDDGPSPTQRASGSLEALIALAESASICRHVSICRYFGENIDETDAKVLKKYCNRMCDICKYPEKTNRRILKLSSKANAAANVPISRHNSNVNNPVQQQQGPSKGNDHSRQKFGENRDPSSRPTLGLQKRTGSDLYGSSSKKVKVTSAPLQLVTKPFGSASGLSKPFKAPTFVRTASGSRPTPATTSAPPIPHVQPPGYLTRVETYIPKASGNFSRARDLEIDVDIEDDTPMDAGEISPPLELPEIGRSWKAEPSTKASEGDRKNAFESLRRSLHRVLMLPFNCYEYWEKIREEDLDEESRNQIIFKAATELELSVISLSSTLEGYNIRIESMRDEIKSLSDVQLWDLEGMDQEDLQDIIGCLRRCSSSLSRKKKGKERMV